eukprot:Nitzschia sp. Nitz4//scaffold26_size159584//115729//116596//NITZ4_002507-RA/size159584-snap-gene-0.48-mRNA-1//-1//CDS//3329545130//3523//frame0
MFPKPLFLLVAIVSCLCPTIVRGDSPEYVTCGSAIKLSHYEANKASGKEHFLNSEGKNLGSGSGQQIVTAIPSATTTNTLWWIRGSNSLATENAAERDGLVSACAKDGTAEPVPCGSVIRLTHLQTMKNLHSHSVKSPLSGQQEVSGFGEGDGNGDNGDDWKVVCYDSSSTFWERESMVAFQHVDSGKYLGAASTLKFTHQNCGHNCPIMDHLEVFGRTSKDNVVFWVVELGVHLSR